MKLLLDTHALIWWLAGDETLSRCAREAIGDEALVSNEALFDGFAVKRIW